MQNDTAVTPYNIMAGQTQPQTTQTSLGGTGGQFGTNNASIGCTPLPSSSIGTNTGFCTLVGQKFQATTLGTDISGALKQVGQDIANASQNSGGGGNPLGFLGPIGSIFGGLFGKEGGLMTKKGYASGGQIRLDCEVYHQDRYNSANNKDTANTGQASEKRGPGSAVSDMTKPSNTGNNPPGYAKGGYMDGGQPKYPNVLRGGHPYEDDDGAEYDQSGIQKDKGEPEVKKAVEPSRRSPSAAPKTAPNVKDFAQGGVEEGGDSGAMHQAGLIQGYFTGAHHQQKYGGNPETLQQAAQEVAQMLRQHLSQGKSPVHLAGGGCSSAMGNMNDSVMQALYNTLSAPLSQDAGAKAAQAQNVPQTDQVNNQAQQPNQQQGTIPGNYIEPLAACQPGQPTPVPQQPAMQDQAPPNPQQNLLCNAGQAAGSNNPVPGQARGGFMAKPPMRQPSENYAAGGPQNRSMGMMNGGPTAAQNMRQGFAQGGPPMPPMGAPNPACQPGAAPPPGGNQPLGPGQTFQGDGQVKGPGGPTDDAIPAKLSNGEFVMSAPATAFIGVDKLTKMNEQGKQGFMQAQGQVDANQPGAANGPPSGAAMPPPGSGGCTPGCMPPTPAAVAKGGFMQGGGQQNLPQMSRNMMKPAKNNAFMGM